MRNELIGYLSIPVIVAGGMSVWKGLNPNQGVLPGLNWGKEQTEPSYSKDEMAVCKPDEAGETEESDDDSDTASVDSGASYDER